MTMTGKETQEPEKGATFDMYHFFSRKDVIAAAAVILSLLLYVVFRALSAAHII